MSEEALYERYKNALRTGHIAAVRGHFETALEAYAEAAALAPDRLVPHVSTGRVLLRLNRTDEALAAFERALRLAPRDETALSGRADALLAAGRPAEAAGGLDLLAEVLEAAGRVPDACDTARRALELAESRARRRHLEGLVAGFRAGGWERGGPEQVAHAVRALEAAAPGRPTGAVPDGPSDELPELPAAEPAEADEPAEAVEPAEAAEEPGLAAGGVQVDGGDPDGVEAGGVLALSEADPGDLMFAVESALETVDPAQVRDIVLGTIAALRRRGLLEAAIDVCHQGLAIIPADPDLHLALAALELDHGWVDAAVDKLTILGRFIELTADTAAKERLCALVDERLPDEARLRELCA